MLRSEREVEFKIHKSLRDSSENWGSGVLVSSAARVNSGALCAPCVAIEGIWWCSIPCYQSESVIVEPNLTYESRSTDLQASEEVPLVKVLRRSHKVEEAIWEIQVSRSI